MSIKSKIALSIIGTGVCIFILVFFFLEKNQNEKINDLKEDTIFSLNTQISESEQIERNKNTSNLNYETAKINISGKEHFYRSFGQKYSNICGIPEKEYFYTMHLVLKNTEDYIFSKRKITDYIIFIPLMILVLLLLIYGLKLLDGVTKLNKKMRLYMSENGKKIRIKNQGDRDEINQMHDIFDLLKSFIADLHHAAHASVKVRV